MTFEAITHNDLNELRSIQPAGWPDIIPDMEFYIRSSFCHPVKVTEDGIITGTGTAIIFGRTAWIAHIIVGSAYRNRGIGGKIVSYLLDYLGKASVESCSLIATDLGKPVYIKNGYNIVSEYLFFERKEKWIPYPVSTNILPFSEKFRTEVYNLDKKITGEDRKVLLNEFIQNILLYVDNDNMQGYYIPGLKEGLIFAGTEEAGIELMKLKYSEASRAVLPSENKRACEFLLQNGFVPSGKGTRMIYGKEIDWKPEMIYSRIGGNLG